MLLENRFNLIDEPWIPVADVGLVSLSDVFSHREYRALGGNPVQKIALTKLLLAIAQSAYTPEDDDDWRSLGVDGLMDKCRAYLDQWYDCFYLYGDKPFLQMAVLDNIFQKELLKAIAKQDKSREQALKPKKFGVGFYPEVLVDNSVVLTSHQIPKHLSDADKAVFVVSLMNFAFSGKRVHKEIPALTVGHQKTSSAKPGPSLGNYVGYLHSYLHGDSLQETIWLNLLTHENINDTKIWENKLGKAPWEEMPTGEGCYISNKLKKSYMGCLVSLSRFALMKDDGIFYVEGIQYESHKNGWYEPSMSLKRISKKRNKDKDEDKNGENENDVMALWLNVSKKPWRELTSLLSFLGASNQNGFDCPQIRLGFQRIKSRRTAIGVWSGGLKATYTSGEHSPRQDDDFIESCVTLPSPSLITGENGGWFDTLSTEVQIMEDMANTLGNSVYCYSKRDIKDSKEKDKRANTIREKAVNMFWQLSEREFRNLLDNSVDKKLAIAMRDVFVSFVNKAYNSFCPMDTARQIDAWAHCRPNLAKYLSNQKKENM